MRPSSLPKLAACTCYAPNPESTPEAQRGILLDSVFRNRMRGDNVGSDALTLENLQAVDWAIERVKAIAGDATILTDEPSCRLAVMEMKGTADAIIPQINTLCDLKTGQIRNYKEQMAAYALGCMDAHFADEWTTHLIFCDQRELITHRFTYEEAKQIVQSVVDRCNDPNKQPTVCGYCDWCARSMTCSARLAIAAPAVRAMEPSFDFEQALSDPEKLGKFLTACSVLDKFREKAEAKAREILSSGGTVLGWKLQSRKSSEFVHHDTVGRYLNRLGFSLVLAAYGNMSAKKFKEIWSLKISNEPIPPDVIQPGKTIQALTKIKE